MARIALTCGDPAGVGPEIIAGWLEASPGGRKDICVIGPASWVADLRSEHGVDGIAVGPEIFSAIAGSPSREGAAIAFEALEAAAAGCRDDRFDAVVTAPVSKEWMRQAGFDFPGQTEFFASRWRGEPTMAFAGGRMRVVLATWHIPLGEVPAALDEACLQRAVARADFLARALGADKPRIGVCGLNPHAGEGGILGVEERDRLDPVLTKLRADYDGLSPCLPGDTVFHRHLQGEFDVVVALYHDQGLAPLKTLEFNSAVNITLGLERVRTSPDHGTAFGIAGQGKAKISSFENAVRMARKLAPCASIET